MSSSIKGAVASGHTLTSEAAAEILRAGGNAFDAAIAAGFAAGVTEPCLTSLGGGGFLLAKAANQKPTLFDFFVDSPGKGESKQNKDPKFFTVPVHFTSTTQNFNVGPGSIAVPGTLKGFFESHKKLGKLPIEDVVAPAIRMAKNGVVVNRAQAYVIRILFPILTLTPEGAALFGPKGEPLKEGETFVNPQGAEFLSEICKRGVDWFYGKECGKKCVDRLSQDEGHLTLEDLESYQVDERAPLEFSFGPYQVLTTSPPATGGAAMSFLLKWYEFHHADHVEWGTAKFLGDLLNTMKNAEQMRDQLCHHLEDLDEKGVQALLEKAKAAKGGTTHISVSDADGNVAALSLSNGEGCGFIAPDTGFMLNNMMGEDDLHPDGFHGMDPGIRVSSMMAPTILLKDNEVCMVLGSGGCQRIRTSILQVILNYTTFGKSLKDAIESSRVHWDGERAQVEPGFDKKVVAALSEEWNPNVFTQRDLYFGGVHAVIPNQDAAADPRRTGAALVVR